MLLVRFGTGGMTWRSGGQLKARRAGKRGDNAKGKEGLGALQGKAKGRAWRTTGQSEMHDGFRGMGECRAKQMTVQEEGRAVWDARQGVGQGKT